MTREDQSPALKATKQFDPTDPTSPMAKHAAALALSQKEFTETLTQLAKIDAMKKLAGAT